MPEIGPGARPEAAGFCEEQIPRLVGALTLYCGDRAVAEELAQEALARAVQHWRKIATSDQREGWVYRVAINLANSRFRRKLAERRANQRISAGQATAEREVDVATTLVVRHAVAELPPRQRAAITLRYYLDLPVGDVAQIMECPESTVKSLTRRGLQRLGQKLEDVGGDLAHG
jgi:RNA polymerase sigma factor (sigma-70 family)